MSHADGLTQEQIDFFKALKPGDRLILWQNNVDPRQTTKPSVTLKFYEDRGGPKKPQATEADVSNKEEEIL